MKYTDHAVDRLQNRAQTKLSAESVLFLVENKIGIMLGKSEFLGVLYDLFLYYDPYRQCCYIAVVGCDTGVLVSVWERDYVLPYGVLSVTEGRLVEATARFWEYLNKEYAKAGCETKIERGPHSTLLATVTITMGGVPIYDHEIGLCERMVVRSMTDAVMFAAGRILVAAYLVVEKNQKLVTGPIAYSLVFKNGVTRCLVKQYQALHQELGSQFLALSSKHTQT